MSNSYDYAIPAIQVPADVRAAFIRRTYGHLAGAILAFIGLEIVFLQSLQIPAVQDLFRATFSSGFSALILLALFIGGSYVAQVWAQSSTSVAMQYAGLSLYVVLEAIIFMPILYIASTFHEGAIQAAGIYTGALFLGLTFMVFTTRADFSYLRSYLCIGGWLALGFIVVSMFMGFGMPLFFIFAMIALASGYIVYDTSNVLHHYRTDQHVAAALALFASVALLFYYILRLVMSFSNRD